MFVLYRVLAGLGFRTRSYGARRWHGSCFGERLDGNGIWTVFLEKSGVLKPHHIRTREWMVEDVNTLLFSRPFVILGA